MTSNADKMGSRYPPMAFTEQGVAMLSSVLRSKKAGAVNIEIMRPFVQLRQLTSTHKELARKIDQMEKKYDKQFKIVFEAIRQLFKEPEPNRRKIGFSVNTKRGNEAPGKHFKIVRLRKPTVAAFRKIRIV